MGWEIAREGKMSGRDMFERKCPTLGTAATAATAAEWDIDSSSSVHCSPFAATVRLKALSCTSLLLMRKRCSLDAVVRLRRQVARSGSITRRSGLPAWNHQAAAQKSCLRRSYLRRLYQSD